jgi:hypothetical protein
MQAYLPPTVGSDIGTALFFTLVGQPGAWSSAGVRMVEQWMTTSAASTPAATAMAAIGLDFAATTPAWGEDYAVSPSVPGLCAEAWKAHYSTAFGDLGDSAPGAPGVDVLPAVYEVP